MTEIERTGAMDRELGRRSVIKGAARSVPVIAAAGAMPGAAATTTTAAALDLDAGCLQVLGFEAFSGFTIKNTGTASWTGSLSVTETIDLSSLDGLLGSSYRSAIWALTTVTGISQYSSAGVTTSAWSGSGGNGWIGSGLFFTAYETATRNVQFTGTIAPGASITWGQLVSLTSGLTFGSSEWTAVITSPTGDPPVVDAGPRELDWGVIGGC